MMICTIPQTGGIPVNVREALAGGARWAGREFMGEATWQW